MADPLARETGGRVDAEHLNPRWSPPARYQWSPEPLTSY